MNKYYWTILFCLFILGCGLGVILGCYLRRKECESDQPIIPTPPDSKPPITSPPPDSGDSGDTSDWLLFGIIAGVVLVVLAFIVIGILVWGKKSPSQEHNVASPDPNFTGVVKYQVGSDVLDVVDVYPDGLCLFHSVVAGENKGVVQPQLYGWDLATKTATDLDKRANLDPQGFGPELKNEAQNIRNWVRYNKDRDIPRPAEYPNIDAAGESLSNITRRQIRFFDQAGVAGNLQGGMNYLYFGKGKKPINVFREQAYDNSGRPRKDSRGNRVGGNHFQHVTKVGST